MISARSKREMIREILIGSKPPELGFHRRQFSNHFRLLYLIGISVIKQEPKNRNSE
jgi:hypothetical protein